MFCIVYVTHESEEKAKEFANILVGERIAACANIFPITSCYWWRGEIENDKEWVSILKTSIERWPRLRDRAEKLHTYDVPCIMKIEVEANESYEKWIHDSVSSR